MATVTWGMLAKSQIDPEKIEEAIARLIAEHNENEEAHLGPGQSLQSHKAAAIIDHLVNSIIADKIKDGEVSQKKLRADSYYIFTAFESLDGWQLDIDIGGGSAAGLLSAHIRTGNISGKSARARAFTFTNSGVVNFAKNPFFQTSLMFKDKTTQVGHFGVGDYDPGVEESKFFGFKIVNGTLYATSIEDGNQGDTEITGIDVSVVHVYRADYISAENKIDYYVDGVLKATRTTYLPTLIWDPIFDYYVETAAAAERWLFMQDLLFSQLK